MAPKSQEIETPEKALINKDGGFTKLIELATSNVNNVDDLIALFGEQGVSYTSGEEMTGDYKVITGDEKQLWASRVTGRRLFVVKWEFYPGNRPGTEFVAMHLVIDGLGKFIVNDGAKSGMYGQLSHITSTRIAEGWSSDKAKAGLLVERGIKKNKTFYYDTRTGKALKKNQYDPSDESFVPEENRAESHPTWSFDF